MKKFNEYINPRNITDTTALADEILSTTCGDCGAYMPVSDEIPYCEECRSENIIHNTAIEGMDCEICGHTFEKGEDYYESSINDEHFKNGTITYCTSCHEKLSVKTPFLIFAGIELYRSSNYQGIFLFETEEEASSYAEELAAEIIESYGGYHGLPNREYIAEDNNLDPEEDSETIEDIFKSECDSWMNVEVEEAKAGVSYDDSGNPIEEDEDDEIEEEESVEVIVTILAPCDVTMTMSSKDIERLRNDDWEEVIRRVQSEIDGNPNMTGKVRFVEEVYDIKVKETDEELFCG